tara:strand:+ start:23274 stop:23579 length:306 start_codon:yes stop_codon:yes gene_type:complete
MDEVIGFAVNKIKKPKIKEVIARIRKILKFENPKTFKVNKSLLFLILIMNHILDKKIIKGRSVIIILGIKILVSNKGIKKLVSRFLKNSISSNKFSITPKQ